MRTQIITALCTLMREDDSLHAEGLEKHIAEQRDAGVGGLLIAGSMGHMQKLGDETYRDLIRLGVEFAAGEAEILVGVGDLSYPRTRDRIDYARQFDVDGLVVLTPGYWTYTQDQLAAYFTALADHSKKPIYLYDLPTLTRNRLDVGTVAALSRHPNIAGIKSSVDWEETRKLFGAVEPSFRIIPAQPFRIAELVSEGIRSNLDGVYGIFPRCTLQIVKAAETGDRELADRLQARLSKVLKHCREVPFSSHVMFSAILNERGIDGRSYVLPDRRPDEQGLVDACMALPEIRAMQEVEAGAVG